MTVTEAGWVLHELDLALTSATSAPPHPVTLLIIPPPTWEWNVRACLSDTRPTNEEARSRVQWPMAQRHWSVSASCGSSQKLRAVGACTLLFSATAVETMRLKCENIRDAAVKSLAAALWVICCVRGQEGKRKKTSCCAVR